jgi:hypothetical protein
LCRQCQEESIAAMRNHAGEWLAVKEAALALGVAGRKKPFGSGPADS